MAGKYNVKSSTTTEGKLSLTPFINLDDGITKWKETSQREFSKPYIINSVLYTDFKYY